MEFYSKFKLITEGNYNIIIRQKLLSIGTIQNVSQLTFIANNLKDVGNNRIN